MPAIQYLISIKMLVVSFDRGNGETMLSDNLAGDRGRDNFVLVLNAGLSYFVTAEADLASCYRV